MKLTDEMLSLDIDEIRLNPHRKKEYFDEDKLKALADDVKDHGLESPMKLVWETDADGTKATLNDEECILKALRLAGHKKLHYGDDFIYTEVNDKKEKIIESLIERIRGEENPCEKAKTLMELLKSKGITSLDVAVCSFNRAKDYINNDFLSEPASRNFFVSKEVIRDLAGYMKSMGVSRTNACDLLALLKLPEDIQGNVCFSAGNTKLMREKTKLNRQRRIVKRDSDDETVMVPFSFAKELARLNDEKIIRFLLRRACEYKWTSKRLNMMITDFINSKLTPDKYMAVYSERTTSMDGGAEHDLRSLSRSMDHMASTLNTVRTVNLIAMAPEFEKKNVEISANGLLKSMESLLDSLEKLLCSTNKLKKIREQKRIEVIGKSFQVIMRTSPNTPGPAYRFTIPTNVGNALQGEYDLQQDDLLELQVVSVIKKGVLVK